MPFFVLAEGLGMEDADVDDILEDVVKEIEDDEARGKAEKLQQEQAPQLSTTLHTPHFSH